MISKNDIEKEKIKEIKQVITEEKQRVQEIKDEIDDLYKEIEELYVTKENIEDRKEGYEEQYNEMIDEQGTIKIGSLEYTASHVLKLVDEIAYNEGYNNYFDERLSEIENEIREKKEYIITLKQEIEDL